MLKAFLPHILANLSLQQLTVISAMLLDQLLSETTCAPETVPITQGETLQGSDSFPANPSPLSPSQFPS